MKKEMIIDLLSEAWSICEDTKLFESINEMNCHSDAETLIYNLKSLPNCEAPDADANCEAPDAEIKDIFKELENILK